MEKYYNNAMIEWRRMKSFRSERSRCKRYVYGDQWDDKIYDGKEWISEENFIRRQGQVPLKNNILRRILRNVIGLYRAQYKVPLLTVKGSGFSKEAVSAKNKNRRKWFHDNRMEELAPRLLEEFLISGLVAVKIEDKQILPVTADNFFFHSDGYDPRGNDIDLIGEIHKVSFGTLLEKFCESPDEYHRISTLYAGQSVCSIVEVWCKDVQVFGILHDEENAILRVSHIADILSGMNKAEEGKGKMEKVSSYVKSGWRRLWFSNDGTLLRESGIYDRHPYVFKAYPFIDGEIHSYISDIIDQQRYVNRLITLYDFIMKSSAKGVLLFPDDSLPRGMSLQEVADQWSRFNGVIPYHAKPGVPMPTQVSGNSANIGITELLKIQMQMLEDISGVSPTLQGKLVANSTSGTLFQQQNEAAQTSLLDILRSFTDFLTTLAENADSTIND